MDSQVHEEIYCLLAYMLASAAGCAGEPKLYGPMRLVDAAQKLIRILDEAGILHRDELMAIANRIDADKLLCMEDKKAFLDMIGETTVQMAELLNGEE